MVAHDRDQHFFGKREKFRIEAAENHRRPLGQVNYAVEQRRILAPAGSGNGAGGGVESFADLLQALVLVQDLGLPKHFGIAGGFGDFDGGLADNAMAARSLPCPHPVKLQGHYFAIEHGHQPAHRTDEALRRLLPIHVLGPVNGVELFGEQLAENFARAPALPGDGRGEIFALGSRDALQGGNLYAGLPGEGLGSCSRLAVFEGHRGGGSGDLFGDVGLGRRNAGSQHRDAAGSVIARNRA